VAISSKTLLRGALGVAISAVAIWILLRSVDLAKVADALRTASPAWILVMFGMSLVDVGARAARWRILLAPIAAVPYRRVLGYTYIGYLANNVLPARLGELVRSHALGEGEGLSRTTVLGTVVVERIVDTAMVVAIAAGSVLLLSVRGVMGTAVLLGVVFVGVLVLALVVAAVADRLPFADRLAGFAGRWPVIVELARRLGEGLAVARDPRTLVGAIGCSLVAWTASIATFLAGANAVGIGLTIPQAALTGSGVALSTIVPSGPGYVGTFELTAKSIAQGFGVDGDRAFATALLVHAVILLVTSVGGIAAIIARRSWHRTGGPRDEVSAILRE
jgi:glycosyltransferase 2 family protein